MTKRTLTLSTTPSAPPDPKVDPVGYAFHMLHEIDHHLAGAKAGTMFMAARSYAQEALDKLRPAVVRNAAVRARAAKVKARIATCEHLARVNGACVVCGVIPSDVSAGLETSLAAIEKGHQRDRPTTWALQVDATGVVHAAPLDVIAPADDHYEIQGVTAVQIEDALRAAVTKSPGPQTHGNLGDVLTEAGFTVRFYEEIR